MLYPYTTISLTTFLLSPNLTVLYSYTSFPSTTSITLPVRPSTLWMNPFINSLFSNCKKYSLVLFLCLTIDLNQWELSLNITKNSTIITSMLERRLISRRVKIPLTPYNLSLRRSLSRKHSRS